jgi:CubicO group peptidase (beta-lactamase class C family)
LPLFSITLQLYDGLEGRIAQKETTLVKRMLPARRAWLAALFIVATVGQRVVAQDTLPRAWRPAVERFAAQLQADVETDDVGGISAGILFGDRLVWSQGFGWADRDRRLPARPQTIYRIGSISKSFTALALMQAVQRGSVKLDDPVTRHLPEAAGFADARPGAAPPSLRQLASHSAGISREPRLAGAAAGSIAQWESKVLASIPATRFDTVPGARYAYSNIGFGVLGLAVARAVKHSFIRFVEDGIFRPLQMKSTTFMVAPDQRPDLAVGYERQSNGAIDTDLPAREHDGRGYKVPNGGIYSTVVDLARFVSAMTGPAGQAILHDSLRAQMMIVQTPGGGSDGYGLGFMVSVGRQGTRMVGHGGSVAGYTAHLTFNPEARIGIILLRNYGSGRTNLARISGSLLQALVGTPADPEKRM